jgi:hypothetical protein
MTRIVIVRLVLLVLVGCGAVWATPQDSTPPLPYTPDEYKAFQTADQEQSASEKIKLLDDFSVKYPESELSSKIDREYYLTYFQLKLYPQTVVYADKYLALGDKIDESARLEALTTRARAFLAGCGDRAFQTGEAYMQARTAARAGLESVRKYPLQSLCSFGSNCGVRDRLEALFHSEASLAEAGLGGGGKATFCAAQNIQIKNIRLFGWRRSGDQTKYTEIDRFWETKNLQVAPSPKFDVICELSGSPDLSNDDFLLWMTVDFLVASATQEYDKYKPDFLSPTLTWDRFAGLQDFKATPIYSLASAGTRRVVFKNVDLAKVVTAFPVGIPGNLWPWFLRINIHVQDRAGREIASEQRVVVLLPDSARWK